jgi:uncharacterized protein GlcG (DUF336 family)
MADIDLATADTMTQAAIALAQQNGWRISVAILDAGGNVVRITRMDDCNFLSPDIARGKAFASVAWKAPSVDLNKRFQNSPASLAGMLAITGGRVAPLQGALPIWDGTRCVGAIGCSGARAEDDEAASRAAIQAARFSETSS